MVPVSRFCPHKLSKESLQVEEAYSGFCGGLEHYAPMTFVDIRKRDRLGRVFRSLEENQDRLFW